MEYCYCCLTLEFIHEVIGSTQGWSLGWLVGWSVGWSSGVNFHSVVPSLDLNIQAKKVSCKHKL